MKTFIFIGACPEFIKAAACYRLKADRLHLYKFFNYTGQHYDFHILMAGLCHAVRGFAKNSRPCFSLNKKL